VRISILRIAVLVVSFALATLFPAAAEEVYNVGGDVTAPKLVHKVEPRYTKRAKKAKLKGTVSLSAVVNREGNPENIEIAKSLDLDLDAEAVKAVSHWRFKPAEKNGKPVAVRIKIQVNFRLCCSLF
jgi:protein TonB